MFAHFYKTPPQHTAEMINKVVKIMQFSIILHFALGFFMLRNSKILFAKEVESSFEKQRNLKDWFT